MRLSIASTAPGEHPAGPRYRRCLDRLADRYRVGEALGHPIVDKDFRAVVERRDRCGCRDVVADVDRDDADDAIDRRNDIAAFKIELGGLQLQPRALLRDFGIEDIHARYAGFDVVVETGFLDGALQRHIRLTAER